MFKFHQNRLSGFGDTEGRNLPYSTALANGLHYSLYYVQTVISMLFVAYSEFTHFMLLSVTFRVSRRRREMYMSRASVCLSVCVSVPRRMPTLLHGPDVTWGTVGGAL